MNKVRLNSGGIKILITVLIISSLILPFVPDIAYAQSFGWLLGPGVMSASNSLGNILSFVADILLRISTLFLAIIGIGLDYTIEFTILNMSKNFGPEGLGPGISEAWGTLRDIANLVFIFILLYAAIQVILDLKVASIGSTIKNIVIVGMLINFSMFFTKVVIDASNIATIGFHNAITEGAKYSSPTKIGYDKGEFSLAQGLSSQIIKATGLQTIYDKNILSHFFNENQAGWGIFATTLFGTITMIVLAVVLLVVIVMFIARFIIIVFSIIISPLALVAYILPKMKEYFDRWKDSVLNQALFPPIFMMLMWVAMKILSSNAFVKMTAGQRWAEIAADPKKVMGLILNFIITIGFVIASLIIAKKIASKSFGFNQVSGAIGTGVMGSAATISRNTLGRWGMNVANNKDLLARAARGDIGARMKLATANKMAGSSFDLRALGDTRLGKATGAEQLVSEMGKAGGKGGFAKTVEEKAKREAEYAKKVFGQTAEEKEELENIKKENEEKIKTKRKNKLKIAQDEEKEADRNRRKHIDNKTNQIKMGYEQSKKDQKEKETELARETDEDKKKKLRDELNILVIRTNEARESLKEKKQDIEENDDEYKNLKLIWEERKEEKARALSQLKKKDIDDEEYEAEVAGFKELKNIGKSRQEEYAKRIERGPLGIRPIGKMRGNKEAARKIREGLKKDTKKQAKDVLKALQDESGETPEAAPAETSGGTGGGTTTTGAKTT